MPIKHKNKTQINLNLLSLDLSLHMGNCTLYNQPPGTNSQCSIFSICTATQLSVCKFHILQLKEQEQTEIKI